MFVSVLINIRFATYNDNIINNMIDQLIPPAALRLILICDKCHNYDTVIVRLRDKGVRFSQIIKYALISNL